MLGKQRQSPRPKGRGFPRNSMNALPWIAGLVCLLALLGIWADWLSKWQWADGRFDYALRGPYPLEIEE